MNKHFNVFFILLLLVLGLLSSSNISKAGNFANPLSPAEPDADFFIGLVLGFGQNMQNGTALSGCDSCFFKGGVEWGFLLGASIEKQISSDEDSYWRHFKYGAMLLYSSQNIKPAFTENSTGYFPEYDMHIPLLMKHTNVMSISKIGLTPYITYNPIQFIFFRFGLCADYLLVGDMKHEVELLEKTKLLPNGEKVNVYIPVKNSNRKLYNYVVEEGEIRVLNRLQFSLMPGLGFDINLSRKFLLSTSYNYTLPLNNISNFGDNFSISTWRIFLELKYNFSDARKY